MRAFVPPLLAAWLVVLWVALWGDLSWANVLSGIAVAAGVMSFTRMRLRDVDLQEHHLLRFRPLGALWFVGFVLLSLLRSNLVLAWEIVTPRSGIRTGIIAVPLRTSSEVIMTIVGNVVTLTTGTMTLATATATADDSADTHQVLYVHVLHLRDPAAVRRSVHRLERFAVCAFGDAVTRRQIETSGTGARR